MHDDTIAPAPDRLNAQPLTFGDLAAYLEKYGLSFGTGSRKPEEQWFIALSHPQGRFYEGQGDTMVEAIHAALASHARAAGRP